MQTVLYKRCRNLLKASALALYRSLSWSSQLGRHRHSLCSVLFGSLESKACDWQAKSRWTKMTCPKASEPSFGKWERRPQLWLYSPLIRETTLSCTERLDSWKSAGLRYRLRNLQVLYRDLKCTPFNGSELTQQGSRSNPQTCWPQLQIVPRGSVQDLWRR